MWFIAKENEQVRSKVIGTKEKEENFCIKKFPRSILQKPMISSLNMSFYWV